MCGTFGKERIILIPHLGLGAGFDSFYEYLLKSHIIFGEGRELEMFIELERQINRNLRKGRPKCRFG